jgi:hypothetical protein
MVTVIVEDGTTVANANSYLSVSEANTLLMPHEDKVSVWDAAPGAKQNDSVVEATRYLDEMYRWYGNPQGASQVLQWPRTIQYDDHGRVIATATVPLQLRKGCARLALEWIRAPSSLRNRVGAQGSGLVKSWSAESFSVAYDTGSADNILRGTRFTDVEHLLHSIGKLKDPDLIEDDRKTLIGS